MNNIEIIKIILQDFDIIQTSFINQPVLSALKWYMTDYKILDDKGMIEINMEDGHISNKVMVKYIKDSDTFVVVKEKLT